MMRAMPELMVMIKGMVVGMRSVAATLVMLLSITYLFAVLFRQLSDGSEIGEEYFSSVPMAIYSLLCEATVPDNGETMTNLGIQEWYLGIMFAVFLLLTSLTILNMLVGVMCEVMTAVSKEKKAGIETDNLIQKLSNRLETTNQDWDGRVNKKDFTVIMEDASCKKLLNDLEVDLHSLGRAEEIIFHDFLPNGHSLEDFVEVLSQYRPTNRGMQRALADLREYIFCHLGKIAEQMTSIEAALQISLRQEDINVQEARGSNCRITL